MGVARSQEVVEEEQAGVVVAAKHSLWFDVDDVHEAW